jgi:hypothetical protein
MATTTTIRVDTETHAALLLMANASGRSLVETTRAAAEALRRQRFADQVVVELTALRSDDAAWVGYLAEADSTDVGDGLG